MTSIGPYTQSNNFTHMFSIPDLRSCKKLKEYHPNSLMDIITTNKNFTKFKYIVKLAKLESILESPQTDLTIFIPNDKDLKHIPEGVFINMDISVAKHIVKSSMLNRKIPSEILKHSLAAFYNTKDPNNKLYISNNSNKTYINNSINIINFDIQATNGMIHVIDNLIYPQII